MHIRSSRRQILLVEDDRMVRETIAHMLDEQYEVLLAPTVGAALALLDSTEAAAIAVILLDCLLPDGKVANILTAADMHAIPVVLISGDHRQAEQVDLRRPFLPKPFSYAALLSVLDTARR